MKVLEFAKQSPNLDSRKLANHFGIGKLQIQAVLKNKENAYVSSETPNYTKRKRSSKHSDVNQAVWDWYTMCRSSNILVSSSMLQEEVTLTAEKLEISDSVASNGLLEKFRQKYSICNKTVAGEGGDVSEEMMEAGMSVQGKLQLGGMRVMFVTWVRWVAFWHGLPEKNPRN